MIVAAVSGLTFGAVIGAALTSYAWLASITADRVHGATNSTILYVGTYFTFGLAFMMSVLNTLGVQRIRRKMDVLRELE